MILRALRYACAAAVVIALCCEYFAIGYLAVAVKGR